MTTPTIPVADTSHPAYTPGWKTSEFWLTVLVAVGGLMKASAAPNTGVGIAGMVLSSVATAGYSASRAYTKANAPVVPQ